MNFTTDLPKKDPIVSYIVASAVQCEKFFPEALKQGPVFRMHAVTLMNTPDRLPKALNPQDEPSAGNKSLVDGFAKQKQLAIKTKHQKINSEISKNLRVSPTQSQTQNG